MSSITEYTKNYIKESRTLLNKCTKPNRKEFLQTAAATAVGFAIFGAVGYIVKLVHIPINNIIIGA